MFHFLAMINTSTISDDANFEQHNKVPWHSANLLENCTNGINEFKSIHWNGNSLGSNLLKNYFWKAKSINDTLEFINKIKND